MYHSTYHCIMKLNQLPTALMMVRPAAFAFNHETAASNKFQRTGPGSASEVVKKAQDEFDQMVELLKSFDVNVFVFEDENTVSKPDAIFPNNWISFHHNGDVLLYPLHASNRRSERRRDIIETLKKDFTIHQILDHSAYEAQGKFLEGTGSLVFDHTQGIVYANVSPRTDAHLVHHIANHFGYAPITFRATDHENHPVYHTNVMLSIGRKFVIICLDALNDDSDQEILLESLNQSGRKIIAISFEQMKRFAANILEVETSGGDSVVILSENAFQSFLPGQIHAISQFSELLPIKIDTIEHYGGGSVRCMVAGIHLPKRN
jgi:hypothetical protein